MDKKLYTSHFKFQGGQHGEIHYDLEARFELSDEEFQVATEVLQEDDHLNPSLPETMQDAICEAAEEQLLEDTSKFKIGDMDGLADLIPGWEEMTIAELILEFHKNTELQDKLFSMYAVPKMIYDLSHPEEVTDSE